MAMKSSKKFWGNFSCYREKLKFLAKYSPMLVTTDQSQALKLIGYSLLPGAKTVFNLSTILGDDLLPLRKMLGFLHVLVVNDHKDAAQETQVWRKSCLYVMTHKLVNPLLLDTSYIGPHLG